MANRALGALATATILSTSSISWAQDAPDADDDAAGSDATLGESEAVDQDAAPGDVEDGDAQDAGADDGGDDSSNGTGDSGSTVDPGVFDEAGPPGTPTVASAPDPGGLSDQEAGADHSPSWGDAAPAAKEVQGPSGYAPVDGCDGCSASEKGESGPLVFAVAALVAAWRRRRARWAPPVSRSSAR